MERKRKGWSGVRCSEGRYWLLPVAVVRRMGLSEGERADTVELDGAVRREQPAPARNDAVRYLSLSERTETQLRSYLRRRGYHAAVIDEVASWTVSHAFVNDARYAEIFVRSRTTGSPTGRSRIRSELRSRGVSEEESEMAVRDLDDGDLFADLVRTIRKKYGALDREVAFRRAAGWLNRRGFRTDLTLQVLREALPGDGEQPE